MSNECCVLSKAQHRPMLGFSMLVRLTTEPRHSSAWALFHHKRSFTNYDYHVP